MGSAVPIFEISEQCVKYYPQIRLTVNYLLSANIYTPNDFKNILGIEEHTMRQFLARDTDKPRYSSTLNSLYHFVLGDYQDVNDPDGNFGLDLNLIDDNEILKSVVALRKSHRILIDTGTVYKLFIRLMDSSFNKIDKIGKKFNGVFYVYRYSIVKSEISKDDGSLIKSARIVKSRLEIFLPPDQGKMWQFTHLYQDKIGKIRETTGIVLTLSSNVYCLGRIEDGLGIDLIVFSEPFVGKNGDVQELTQALVMSLDPRNQPIISRAVLKYAGANRDQIYGPFDVNDDRIRGEIEGLEQFIENPSDRDRAAGLNLT